MPKLSDSKSVKTNNLFKLQLFAHGHIWKIKHIKHVKYINFYSHGIIFLSIIHYVVSHSFFLHEVINY